MKKEESSAHGFTEGSDSGYQSECICTDKCLSIVNAKCKKPESIEKLAWSTWEEDQKTNPHGVNPHAYVYGFCTAFKKFSLLKEGETIALPNTLPLNTQQPEIGNLIFDALYPLRNEIDSIPGEMSNITFSKWLNRPDVRDFIYSRTEKAQAILENIVAEYAERKVKQEFENLYKEMQDRLTHLESLDQTITIHARIAELQLCIVRVQQILISKITIK